MNYEYVYVLTGYSEYDNTRKIIGVFKSYEAAQEQMDVTGGEDDGFDPYGFDIKTYLLED